MISSKSSRSKARRFKYIILAVLTHTSRPEYSVDTLKSALHSLRGLYVEILGLPRQKH